MTSDGKGKRSDAPEPSAAKTPDPSTPPKTYNQEEVDTLLNEKHSKLDTRIADLEKAGKVNTKANTTLKAQLKTSQDLVVAARKDKEEAEFAAIPRDNPDALSLFTARQAHRDDVRTHEANVASFDERKAQYEADLAELVEYKKFQVAVGIVSKDEYKGVSAKSLVELTDGSPDKMEDLAKILKLTVGENPASQPSEIPPDSGAGQGGAGQLSTEQIENMSMEDYVRNPSNVERMKTTE